MDNGRFLAVITSIRKKYSRAVFDLEKLKENEKILASENKKLIEECEEYRKRNTVVQEEKEKISSQLEEALKKIEQLTCEKASLSEQAKQMMIEKESYFEAKTSSIQNKESVLQARLKQMELGIERKKQFQSQNELKCVEEAEESGYDIDKILDHQKKGSAYSFLVRWKGYGPDADTWEPKSNLQCKNCKIINAYLKKNKI